MYCIGYSKLICIWCVLFFGCDDVTAVRMSSSKNPLISAEELRKLVKNSNVKIIDATYSGKIQIPEWKIYQTTYYGKFDKLFNKFTEEEYKNEHIPGALPLSMDVAFYPGEFKRYALYPPGIFEQLLRKIGINNDDQIIIYGRGHFSGMIYAAHIWWLLKYYGVENVKVLNGGLEAWKKSGNPINNESVILKNGNFKAMTNSKFAITFEELETRNEQKIALIDHLNTENIFDGRPNEQFTGKQQVNYVSSGELRGSHIKGSKNLPVSELIDENGLKTPEQIRSVLDHAGYNPGKSVITYCSVGNQGSLLLLALYTAGVSNIKLYQGGMTEMALRDPDRIA